jgi:hypothetical protein
VIHEDALITWLNAGTAPHTVTGSIGIDEIEPGRLFDPSSLGQRQKFSILTKQLAEEEPDTNFDYYLYSSPILEG